MLEKKIQLANKLAQCILACNHCLNSCLDEENIKMMTDCIRLDKECAEICSMTLLMLHHHGRFSKEVMMFCKNACLACAQECRRHDNSHCRYCAEKCEECAAECDAFLKI